MPYTNCPTCISCNRVIRSLRIRFLSKNLLRIFVSIEQRKRVTASDAICDGCRSNYIQWKKLVMGNFDHLDTSDEDYSELDYEVNGYDNMVILTRFEYSILYLF